MFLVGMLTVDEECGIGGGCAKVIRFGIGPSMCLGVASSPGRFAGGTLYLENGMFGNVRDELIVIATCSLDCISCILICMFTNVRW